MIVGTGIDIVEVDRIAEKLAKSNAFREKVYSPNEIEYCDSCANPAQHYAARFAAKEAFLKATGQGMTLTYELKDISVVVDHLGKPEIQFVNTMKDVVKMNGWSKVHLSISHISQAACAVVIIEK